MAASFMAPFDHERGTERGQEGGEFYNNPSDPTASNGLTSPWHTPTYDFDLYGGNNAGYQRDLDRTQRLIDQNESLRDQYDAMAMDQRIRPSARESGLLSSNQEMSRAEQMAALDMARESASGGGPSASPYMLAIGSNAAANARGVSGAGARGSSGLWAAQNAGNAAQMSMLGEAGFGAANARSAEMSQNMAQYGNLAGQIRGADLSRLQQTNRLGNFNADIADQRRIQAGQLANAYGGLGLSSRAMQHGVLSENQRLMDEYENYRHNAKATSDRIEAEAKTRAKGIAAEKSARDVGTGVALGKVATGGLSGLAGF